MKRRSCRKIFRLAEARQRVWPKAALGGNARVPGKLGLPGTSFTASVSATTVKGHKEELLSSCSATSHSQFPVIEALTVIATRATNQAHSRIFALRAPRHT
jgi:hypothetical protein